MGTTRPDDIIGHDANADLPRWAAPALIAATVLVYLRVLSADFVSFDDWLYVTDNPMVNRGLSLEGLRWAFGLGFQDGLYWHPLTWLQLMLETQAFGLRPFWFHLTGVVFHSANSLLVLLLVKRLTGDARAALVTAVLFALHPVNVESVAWVAARKNQLSTFFYLATLVYYTGYARKKGIGRWLAVTLTLVLGLLAKPFVATAGCLMLVLDVWPLQRWRPGPGMLRSGLLLVFEKIPWIALGVIVSRLATIPMRYANSAPGFDDYPLALRLAQAPVSLVQTLGKLIAPVRLSIFNPFPTSLPVWQAAAALTLLAAISGAAVFTWRRWPFLLTGWLWFLGTSVPVLGVLQAGVWPAHADRWAYFPTIGILLVAGMGASAISKRITPRTAATAAALVIGAMASTTIVQTGHWRNTETLFEHALDIDPDNHVALDSLGNLNLQRGDVHEALRFLNAAVEAQPGNRAYRHSLAAALAASGRTSEAETMMIATIEDLRDVRGLVNLATLYSETGRHVLAINLFREALGIDPDNITALNGLGVALARAGRFDDAETILERAAAADSRGHAATNLDRLRRQRRGEPARSAN